MREKYRCIAHHRTRYDVALMCRVLRVSRSGFYAAQRRTVSRHARRDAVLRGRVRAIFKQSRRTYGSPRIQAELVADGERCSRKRIVRLMREEGLVARRRRRFRVTTTSTHTSPVAPNVVDRQFAVAAIAGPDRVWAGDITYVPTREGWLYLAVVLDLGLRLVVGWSMQSTLAQSLTLEALRMALARRRPGRGILHHSDRGSQYACADYRALLETHGMVCSMSKKGDCFDNAVAESFFATLKVELVHAADWATREEARAAIFEYIETWYNRHRRHSSLGYLSPMQYEVQQGHAA